MQLTLNSLALVFGALSLAVSATPETFLPRVWRTYRTSIPVDTLLEIDSVSGDAVIYKTPNNPGVECYINDPLEQTPVKGTLIHASGNETYTGYLVPLPGVTSSAPAVGTHYQLRFSKTPITETGVLSTDFTKVTQTCGGNCFGTGLDYPLTGFYGVWYLIKEDETSPVYNLRWTFGTYQESASLPEGALNAVFVWVS